MLYGMLCFFETEEDIRAAQESRGLGCVYKRQNVYDANVYDANVYDANVYDASVAMRVFRFNCCVTIVSMRMLHCDTLLCDVMLVF